MAFIEINVRGDVEKMRKRLNLLERQQLPFATALALTNIAKKVQAAETDNFQRVFDRPTPFTKKGVGIKPATKTKLEAVVFVKDIQAVYLTPYEFTGRQVPHKIAILTPKKINLNQYGNIPRGKLQTLRGKGTVFTGAIVTKKGERISGVWQRPTARSKDQHLKLLVRFTDPQVVKQHLDYRKLALATAKLNFRLEMHLALQRAMATRR